MMDKPDPPKLGITWCLTPINGSRQCSSCLRNKQRYNFPDYGTFHVQILSPKQRERAREGCCATYKVDNVARRAQRVNARREEALKHTECATCRSMAWGERSRAAIAYCENFNSDHHGQPCPNTKCGFYTRRREDADGNPKGDETK
jgi:hypothetical protein